MQEQFEGGSSSSRPFIFAKRKTKSQLLGIASGNYRPRPSLLRLARLNVAAQRRTLRVGRTERWLP